MTLDKRIQASRSLHVAHERVQWLAGNPLRLYVHLEHLGFIKLSHLLGGKISAFRLQKLTLGFDRPTGAEYTQMSTLIRTDWDINAFYESWEAWYHNRPTLGLDRFVERRTDKTVDECIEHYEDGEGK